MVEPWIYPLPLALVVIALGALLLWRDRRVSGALLIGIAVIGLYGLSTPAVSDRLVASLEQRYPPPGMEDLPPVDAIVVLGGGVQPAAEPRTGPDLGAAADRLWHGAELYRAGKAPLVIVTGARPYEDLGPSAAEAARDVLVRLGVPRGAIVLRPDSTSTYEDAVAVRGEIGARTGVDTLLLVTSAMHMQRAMITFQALGLQVWPAPTDRRAVRPARRGEWPWLPSHVAFADANHAWHEYVGLLYYQLRGWI